MRNYIILIVLLATFYAKAQIEPFVDYDWTIEKIETFDGTTIMADANENGDYDVLDIYFSEFNNSYNYFFDECQGTFTFNDSNQSFKILYFVCAITTDPTNIAAHFLYIFILEEGGETATPEGPVYGPFSYDFTYSGDLLYLHITNLAGSVATFYATNLSQEEFLRQQVKVYPNPAIDILKIESSGVAIGNIKIYDINGRLVEEAQINQENQINVSQLQKGIYILHIETAVGALRKKIIKQ